MSNIVTVKNISMNYHTPIAETKAISNVSFDVSEGEFVSIVGPSGCGKTTLLSIINGLIKPSSGKVCFNTAENGQSDVTIGYMLQKDNLLEWRSLLQNVTLGLEIQKKLTDENVKYTESLLNKYGLGDFKKHHPSQLSGGMRQRAALIRTLATKPDILLLDEPFSALDYQTRLYVSDEIGTILRNEKKTAILVTHDIGEAISLSDRVIVMSKRPSYIVNIHNIEFSLDERTPMKAREDPEFRHYFNKIWRELDVHV